MGRGAAGWRSGRPFELVEEGVVAPDGLMEKWRQREGRFPGGGRI